jgi:hypothetical protein
LSCTSAHITRPVMQACDLANEILAAGAADWALATVAPSTPPVAMATLATSHRHDRPRIIAQPPSLLALLRAAGPPWCVRRYSAGLGAAMSLTPVQICDQRLQHDYFW